MDLGFDPLIILRFDWQKKIGVAAGLLVVIAIAYWYVWFSEKQTQLETLDQDIAKQVEEITKLEADVKKRPQLEQELLDLSQKEAEASKVLPVEKQIPDLLSTVSSKANIQGLKNNLFQPRPEVPSGIYATIPIDLEMKGGYHQTAMFNEEIAKLYRIVKVNEFRMSNPQRDQDALIISVRASTYRFLNKAPELPASIKKGQKKAGTGKSTAGQPGGAK